jgi:lipoprotein NlpD
MIATRAAAAVRLLVLCAVLGCAACGTHTYHIVQPGDSLYSIGWAYGYDYKDLAQWNDLKSPYALSSGQRIRLVPPGFERGDVAAHKPQTHIALPKTSIGTTHPPHDARSESGLTWQWPARGAVLSRYDANDAMKKGMNIGGQLGQPVHAAAPGKVVYSGSGLIGYGKLIILKHNDTYLSAYAHNKELLVHEGDLVEAGKQIAEMGNSGSNVVMLHFEIRRDGVPVDPLSYLPGTIQ